MSSPNQVLGIVIVGAGGHAKVVIENFRSCGQEPSFCIGSGEGPGDCLGVPVLYGDDNLPKLRAKGYRLAFVAVGSNTLRRELATKLSELGFDFANAVHTKAVVSPTAIIGQGVAVMAGAVISACTRIGNHVIVNTGATIDHDGNIEDYAHIAPQSGLAGTVSVGQGSFLCAGCTVIPGIRIGQSALVAAGAVVIRDVPEGARVAGVPARTIP